MGMHGSEQEHPCLREIDKQQTQDVIEVKTLRYPYQKLAELQFKMIRPKCFKNRRYLQQSFLD